jgi:hypothetical protein
MKQENLSVNFYDEVPKSKRKKLLLFGSTKTGKTYFSGTAPNPFVIDTDDSLDGLDPSNRHVPFVTIRLENADGVRWTLNVNGKKQDNFEPSKLIYSYIRMIRDKRAPFDKIPVDTIVLDGLTSMGNLFLIESMLDPVVGRSEKKLNGTRNPLREKPTYDEYSTILMKFNVLLSILEDCNVNICATAGIKMDKDEETGRIFGFPDIVGSFRQCVGHYFTSVCFTDVADNKHVMYVDHKKYKVGARNWTGPGFLENPTFEKFLKYSK